MRDDLFLLCDQYGSQNLVRAVSVRKAIEKETGRKHLQRIYVDSNDGKVYHVGYIAAGRWFHAFKCEEFRKERK